MKTKQWLAVPLAIAALLQVSPALSEGLLGGLVNIGSGDTNSGALVDLNLGGSSGDLANADVGGLIGADIDLGGSGGNRLNADITLGGGTNGTNGTNGVNGINGRNGTGVFVINNGGGGGMAGSSRLRMLANILENRAWLRFAQRNQLCLPAFGVAQVTNWLPAGDNRALPRLLNAYAQDIGTLQTLLKNCRGSGRNLLGQLNLNQVIGLDQRGDGSLVLFVL